MTLPAVRSPELDPVRRLLQEASTFVLATRSADGRPRATPLYFAADEALRLVFVSDPNSLHSRNLAHEAQASAALYPPEADWRRLRGVQMQGRVARLEGAEAQAARDIYGRRFPFVGQLSQALAASGIYALTPSWIRLIDNRRGFGFQQEWTLA